MGVLAFLPVGCLALFAYLGEFQGLGQQAVCRTFLTACSGRFEALWGGKHPLIGLCQLEIPVITNTAPNLIAIEAVFVFIEFSFCLIG